jgi:hypothetical protein
MTTPAQETDCAGIVIGGFWGRVIRLHNIPRFDILHVGHVENIQSPT